MALRAALACSPKLNLINSIEHPVGNAFLAAKQSTILINNSILPLNVGLRYSVSRLNKVQIIYLIEKFCGPIFVPNLFCGPLGVQNLFCGPTFVPNLFCGPLGVQNLFCGPLGVQNLFCGPLGVQNLFCGPLGVQNLFCGPTGMHVILRLDFLDMSVRYSIGKRYISLREIS